MDFSALRNSIIEGDAETADELTQQALAEGIDPLVLVNNGLIPGMDVVGEKFKNYEFYLPEVLVSARAMKTAMAHVTPLLAQRTDAKRGRVVIGTIKGDLHDIGKNLVGMMMEGAGMEVIDLGTNIAPEEFIRAVEENEPQILCLSALLTTTIPVMKTVVALAKESEVRQKIKIMVGGAPLTQKYANDIGADGYAAEAASAVEMAKELIKIS